MAELRMERRFAAAPDKVFAFVTETPRLMAWWCPPGTTAGAHDLDFTRVGPWYFVMHHPQRGEFRMSGDVRRVEPPNLVEFTMNVPGVDTGEDSVVRFELANDGSGGTSFALIQTGLSAEMAEHGKMGWAGPLNQLEALINAA
jgi:uncharacterized protein YndB with AHSA1/START domain